MRQRQLMDTSEESLQIKVNFHGKKQIKLAFLKCELEKALNIN